MSLADTALRNPIEFRAATVTDVRYPERIIDVVAVPYNEPTPVEHRGRMILETIAPGAFAAAAAHPRIRPVYREHNYDRHIGVVRKLVDNSDNLRAELKMAKTDAGWEALEMADDDMLAASIGFAPKIGCEQWAADRRSRTITDAFLEHIALVALPAYENARVLAVRDHPRTPNTLVRPATPNLDTIRAAHWAAVYDRIH